MDKVNHCNCPFTDWCEEGRQWLQEMFRKEDKNYKVTDCDFYKAIKDYKAVKELERKDNARRKNKWQE